MIRNYKKRVFFKLGLYNFLFDTDKREESLGFFLYLLEVTINSFKKYILFKKVGFTHVYADVVIYGGCNVIDNAIALKFLKNGISVCLIQDGCSNNKQQIELNKVLSINKINSLFYKSLFNDFDMSDKKVEKELDQFISLNPNMFCYVLTSNNERFVEVGKFNKNDKYSYVVSVKNEDKTCNDHGDKNVYSKKIISNKFCKNIKFLSCERIKIPSSRSHGVWSKLYLISNPYYKTINKNVLLSLKDGNVNHINSKDMLKNIVDDILSLDKKITDYINGISKKNT